MTMSLHEHKRVSFNISKRRRAEDAARMHAERQAMLLEITSDLIRASEPGELGRKTFEHVKSALGAVVCTNYRLDPVAQRLKLVFVHGIPPEHLEAAQSLELGQEYCGATAASCQPLVADRQRIASDPNGSLVRGLGATAYACYPLKACDGHLLGTFAVASATRENFTNDEVAWLGTITNFLAQAWERFEAEQSLRVSEERLRATFDNAAVGIAHAAPDGRWLRVNDALCRIFGYPVDELVAKTFQDITHPDDLKAEVAQVELMREGKIDSYDMDKRYLRKDGAIVWGRKTVGCVRKSDGSIDYFVNVVEDVTARKRIEEELRKSEERFRSSLLHSPLPILLFDDREEILALSQSWLDQTGYSREELRRIEDWMARAYADERSGEALEHTRQIIRTRPEARRDERTIRTKDGRKRLWSFVTSALGTQSDGRRVFVCVAQDVTQRKAHEDHVHLLMREINHRAKNMLSLVQAIARQTAARDREDFIGCFTERIQALAANQDLLIRNEWKGVDIEELARAQLAHFADVVGSRIHVDGPKLRLNAAAAQAIGLALHELATNAGKYGALSTDRGRVNVCWGTVGDTFTMTWTERDGPPVSSPKRRGFGTTVIETMAKHSLDGAVDLDFAPSGVTWQLTCPVANALEP
jgi:PAS domain S-box-containing protein